MDSAGLEEELALGVQSACTTYWNWWKSESVRSPGDMPGPELQVTGPLSHDTFQLSK